MNRGIYLDNAATTPLDPRVRDAMLPYLEEAYGNPSSLHWAGRHAREAVSTARARVAHLLHAKPGEIVFTASGTESTNLALIGVCEAAGVVGGHVITSAIEHPAVLETCRYLESRGVAITRLGVSREGIVDPGELREALRRPAQLVSVMMANNVAGTLQPVNELGRIAHEHGALFHTDAVQAVGKIPVDVSAQPIDLLSLSAHKLYGPKGVGALYVRAGVQLAPFVHGGGQERGLRSATENVAGIVGLGRAAEIASAERADEAVRLVRLRDRLIESVLSLAPQAYLIGHRYQRLPGHICLGFCGLEGDAVKLLLALDAADIAVSTGSACSANHGAQPSYILQAMGYDVFQARGSLRVTLGRFNSEADVDEFVKVLPDALRLLSPLVTIGTGMAWKGRR
ncbi:MAG: cysteine desulfurase family protein [Bryobacteraceae bacterium]